VTGLAAVTIPPRSTRGMVRQRHDRGGCGQTTGRLSTLLQCAGTITRCCDLRRPGVTDPSAPTACVQRRGHGFPRARQAARFILPARKHDHGLKLRATAVLMVNNSSTPCTRASRSRRTNGAAALPPTSWPARSMFRCTFQPYAGPAPSRPGLPALRPVQLQNIRSL